MTQQWLRYCKLTVEGGGEAIDLSAFRIRFTVKQHTLQTPNLADIVITNLAPATAQKIKKEGQIVSLEAGYESGFGLIFKGNIIQRRIGRESPTDTYLNLIAANGDQAYNYGKVSKTLAAGHTYLDQVHAAAEAMKPYGVSLGYIADLGSKQMPRSRVLFGMARDILRTVAISTNTNWSVQNGQLTMVKNDEAKPGSAVVLNSTTGLIGMPQQTIYGISARCLLNPAIAPNSLIHIDQSSIQEAVYSVDNSNLVGTAETGNNAIYSTMTAADGFYTAVWLSHTGDTRGQPWYTDIICWSANSSGQMSNELLSLGLPSL